MIDFAHIRVLPELDIFPGGCEYDDMRASLTPVQGLFLSTLRKRHPAAVSIGELMNSVYAGGEWPQDKILHAHACHINKRINEIGLNIENVWGYGYRLRYDV